MSIMKKMLIIAIYLIFSTASSFAQEQITLTNCDWEPFQSKKLKHYGVASHIVSDAFALVDIKVKYKFFPCKRAIETARSGDFHGTFLWLRTPDRKKDFYYSDVIVEDESVFFHLKTFDFDWATFEDLAKYRVGGTLGYKYAFEYGEYADKIKIKRVPKDKHSVAKLLEGRIDVFPSSKIPGYAILHKNFTPEQINKITYHKKPYLTDSYHLIMSKLIKGNERYVKLFNKGLKLLRENGTYDEYTKASIKGQYEKK